MMLFGIGAEMAVTSALVYLLAHAAYKGTLFLVAGTLEHETGTRDVTALAGLRRVMPRPVRGGGFLAPGPEASGEQGQHHRGPDDCRPPVPHGAHAIQWGR